MKKRAIALTVILLLSLGACAGSAGSGGSPAASAPPPANSGGASPTAPSPSAPAMPGVSTDAIAEDGSYPGNSEPMATLPAEDIYYNPGGERYLEIQENQEKRVSEESLLTFSLKVDTSSYTNVARYLESGSLPPADAVRTEELINYFAYDAGMDFGDDPFAVYTEVGPSPFDPAKKMAFIRVKARDIDKSLLPSSNLTFLIDTSGSMNSYDKLPLLKEAFRLLTETLDEDDTVSVVTYAGSSAVVLDSAGGGDKERILEAIDRLEAGGSTAGAQGIMTAYALAEKNYMAGGNNRVILASDGDFNVGTSDTDELAGLIGEKRDSGIYISILGFGTGNIRDDIMETLSKHGNGNYAYINSLETANKVLVEELASNLFTVANDVKAQVEFNPENVESYRLIGYENRRMANRDFDDDTKDAGEIGAGTDVVVLFELTLAGEGNQELKYGQTSLQTQPAAAGSPYGDELFEVRIRYKQPGENESSLVLRPVTFRDIRQRASDDFQFAGSVAVFGGVLRDSAYAGKARIEEIMDLAGGSLGRDAKGYRRAYLNLLRQYQALVNRAA